jgi:hypothetical protein
VYSPSVIIKIHVFAPHEIIVLPSALFPHRTSLYDLGLRLYSSSLSKTKHHDHRNNGGRRHATRRRASRHRGTCDTKSLLVKNRFQASDFWVVSISNIQLVQVQSKNHAMYLNSDGWVLAMNPMITGHWTFTLLLHRASSVSYKRFHMLSMSSNSNLSSNRLF